MLGSNAQQSLLTKNAWKNSVWRKFGSHQTAQSATSSTAPSFANQSFVKMSRALFQIGRNQLWSAATLLAINIKQQTSKFLQKANWPWNLKAKMAKSSKKKFMNLKVRGSRWECTTPKNQFLALRGLALMSLWPKVGRFIFQQKTRFWRNMTASSKKFRWFFIILGRDFLSFKQKDEIKSFNAQSKSKFRDCWSILWLCFQR